ncbi:hypothetical protein NQK81_13430 [Amycolatopsis roodepoortensis]|nr:hypothetical protein [Amycolatopsis roodepoortensis]UUV34407.1 hypothetical protein NQK81_13430 [Amycolatopsis roodepoortensis]
MAAWTNAADRILADELDPEDLDETPRGGRFGRRATPDNDDQEGQGQR